jgi:hypothetical protein
MAKLLTGTRIYGTGTVDTQLFVSGTNSATSTTTGALQVVGGVGIGGNLYVGGTIFGGIITGTASTATNADNIKTVLQVSSATYYPTFVDANNSTAAYEALYTTSSFNINPATGAVGIVGTSTAIKLQIGQGYGGITYASTSNIKIIGNPNNNTDEIFINLVRDRNPGVQFAGAASITLGSYIVPTSASAPSSRLTFLLKNTTDNTDVANVSVMSLLDTGNVGIGTTLPTARLQLGGQAGSVATPLALQFSNDYSSGSTALGSKIFLYNTGGTEVYGIGVGPTSDIQYHAGGVSNTAGKHIWYVANSEKLRITTNGGIAFSGASNYGVSGQILQSNGDAAPTWISTGSLAAANATTATHLSGGTAGQVPYQTAPGVTSFYGPGTAGNVLVSNGTGAPTYNNTLTLTGTTNATSTTTGALQVVGGVGVGGDLFIRGDILTNDTTFNLINANATTVNFAGAATTLAMGASGSGTTNVRNNLTVSGNLTVQGTTTIVDSTVTNIADPIITLGGGTGDTAPTADDNKDRGVAFKWVNNGGTTSTGFFGYDDSTGYFTYVQTATITNEVVSGTKGAMDVNLAGGTAMSIVYQSSPNNTGFLAASTSGYILQTNGTGSPPTWVSASGVSAGSAANADSIRTIAQTASATYYPTFVDSNNASNAYELVYTTSSFYINPNTGAVNIGGNLTAPYLYASGGATFNQQVYIDMNGVASAEALALRGGSGASGGVYMKFMSPSATTGYFGHDKPITGGSTYDLTAYSTAGLGFRVHTGGNATPRLVITANGGVSFGSTSSYGTSGQLLQSNGDAVPTWINASGLSVGNVNTVLQTASASYFPTFVDSNNASATAESLYTTSSFVINPQSGNVGIGTSSPSVKLHVVGNTYLNGVTTSTGALTVNSTLNAVGKMSVYVPSTNTITFADNTSTAGLVIVGTGDRVRLQLGIGSNAIGPYGAWIQASYDNTGGAVGSEPLLLNPAGGYVGIGTTSPTTNLHVYNSDASVNSSFLIEHGNTSRYALMQFKGAGAKTFEIGTGGSGTGSYNGALYFYDVTAASERLRITTNGGIAFGGASNYGSAGQILQSNGDAAPTWVALSSRTVGTSTQVNTVLQTASASYFPTFVDSNNAAATAESLYTTSSFSINPGTGLLTVTKTAQIGTTVAQGDPSATDITANATLLLSGIGGNYLSFGQKASNLAQWIQSGYLNPTTAVYPISLNPLGGNVGIGTLTPGAPLAFADSVAVKIQLNGNNANGYQIGLASSVNGGDAMMKITAGVTGAGEIGFYNTTNLRLLINNAGNVGIGTSTPNDKLQVQTSSATAYDATNDQGQYGSGAGITVTNLDETSQSFAQINLQVSANAGRAVGRIVAIRTASATSDLAFVTENANTKAEKMRIFSNGNVSIGTTSTTNKFEVAGTAGQLFSVSDSFTGTIFSANDVSGIPSIEVLDTGLVKLAQYNGAVTIGTGTVSSSTAELSVYGMLYTSGAQGEIRASSEITAYFSSDQRLKENIKLIENPITIIDQIRGVTFDWTDEHMARRGGEDGYFVRKHDIGVIAQEVQAVLPELVGTREDGYLAVKYEKMVPLLIEAIKSQQKTIDTLTSEIKEIKEFLSSLKNN